MHSLEEQERFDERENMSDDVDELRRTVQNLRDEILELTTENRELRIMLAIAHAGLDLYTDDGEFQDNRVQPFIDFRRDSVAEIERKLRERAYARAKERKLLTTQAHL